MPKVYTSFPVTLFARPQVTPPADWVEIERGPGNIELPEGQEYGFRIHNIDDYELRALIKELAGLAPLVYANLSENRKITDDGLKELAGLPQLTTLNLSSCGLTSEGIPHLKALTRLHTLDISFCNRLTGPTLRALRLMPSLRSLNLQGCVKITNGDVARFNRPDVALKK